LSESNRALIRSLYDALARKDGEAMASCYASEARFRDPAFGELRGGQVGDMWRMLTGRARDLAIELVEHDADEESGSARWTATYTFTQTGREVTNNGQASFRFADGLITEHVDEFSFFAWSRQALGPLGLALGWTPLLPALFRHRARRGLEEFSARRS
jgi:ketosteroid isomerase-like protein